MIHTKKLQFTYNHINFESSVTYSDLPFSQSKIDAITAFYDVKLLKPKVLECGGEVKQINGVMSMMIYAKQAKDRHYDYSEDRDVKEDEKIVNVYPLAVRKILYSYFNKDSIIYYKQKIDLFNEAVDKKYALLLSALKEDKLLLKKRLKSNEINSKGYQKLYTPIRLNKEEIEFKIFRIKKHYAKRYFLCCELRSKYCTFKTDKLSTLQDAYPLCGLTSYLANMQKDTKC